MKKITIAIDGYSSCGKSTMAKTLAKRIGYIYVDTGAMYRAVTLFALQNGVFDEHDDVDTKKLEALMPNLEISFKLDEQGVPQTYLNGKCVEKDIRRLEVSKHVSSIAAIPFVRHILVREQQAMGDEKGIVMDGRDIGTTVFPDAELKIFVTATAAVRAKRRYEELQEKGIPADYEEILKNVQDRDYIDTHREISPLQKAKDALILDNSNMSIDEQNEWLMDKYLKAVSE